MPGHTHLLNLCLLWSHWHHTWLLSHWPKQITKERTTWGLRFRSPPTTFFQFALIGWIHWGRSGFSGSTSFSRLTLWTPVYNRSSHGSWYVHCYFSKEWEIGRNCRFFKNYKMETQCYFFFKFIFCWLNMIFKLLFLLGGKVKTETNKIHFYLLMKAFWE